MKRFKITICLITYMQEATVAQALKSVFDQDYSWDELIVSDDGSKDATVSVIKKELEKYRRYRRRVVVLESEKNQGLASNLNKAIEEASGDLIFAFAGDDISMPNRVSQVVSIWEQLDCRPVMFHSDAELIDDDGLSIGELRASDRMDRFSRDEGRLESSTGWGSCGGEEAALQAAGCARIIGATQVWTSDLFHKFGPLIDELMIEDEAMALRAAMIGEIIHVQEPLVKYRVGGISSWDKWEGSPRYVRSALRSKAELKKTLYIQKIKDIELLDYRENLGQIANRELSYWILVGSASTFSFKTFSLFVSSLRNGVPLSRCVKAMVSIITPRLYARLARLKIKR
ncbi:MAG: glycosyltransferase [Pseudomonadota bacterium]|nr:glycosyltransferase [Pseudomonadota bacterium]